MSVSSLYLNQDKTVRFKKRKARFSFSEVHILLDEVRKNRHILVGKFNTGVPSDVKKRKWAEITARINEIGECDREIMEVVKKWSDLKCDTRRKVAALQSGGNLSLSQRLARSNIELSPTEVIVESILELDKKPWEASQRTPIRSYSDEQEGGDEEEEDGSLMGLGSVHSSPGRGMDMGGMPAAMSGAVVASEMQYDGSKTRDPESNMVDSDEDSHDHLPSSSMVSVSNSHSEVDGIATRGNIGHVASTVNASNKTAFSGVEPECSREQLAHNASLSVQQQHASNTLLSTVSRSLEILAESVQQLAETQQEFARESLQLQRDTVQVLQEFASGTLTILQEKVNGKPVL
ncbi:uncharacterized protein LOC127640669 [Xyrauchen texanus]|uniref:uncharacterized protein LOC127640669 n=1 Tax=Xyrauchen texanus TaxID=154827 RepID=UPI002242AB0C|nr:uncharacterized protein LOC127640669 [Xyrauchen texanus]